MLEGDSFEIPLNLRRGQTKLQRKWLSLRLVIGEEIVEDYFAKVQLVQKGSHCKIKLENLAAGQYQLRYVEGATWVRKEITVL